MCMCPSTKFVLQSAAVSLLAALQQPQSPGFKVCLLSCHRADRGRVWLKFRVQCLKACWLCLPCWLMFWKESLNCLKIMCCIME